MSGAKPNLSRRSRLFKGFSPSDGGVKFDALAYEPVGREACRPRETRLEREFFGILGSYLAKTDENARKFQPKNRSPQTCRQVRHSSWRSRAPATAAAFCLNVSPWGSGLCAAARLL